MAENINLRKAAKVKDIDPQSPGKYESRETTHFSVIDRFGNAVSNTYTLGYSFGSGFVAGDTGILLDNQMRNFSYSDGPDHPNAMRPGKRMLSTMTPTMVFATNGKVMLVTGTPGGSRIINIILQLLVDVIDYDLNIAEATHRPRIHQGWRSQTLGVENGLSVDTILRLEEMGHSVEVQRSMGSTQSIIWRDGLFYGSADPRRPNALALGLDEPPADAPGSVVSSR
jgi:gamma-glutamyltranspeptidase/glutathione hydrolase